MLLSQRPAKVHKDSLSQVATLVPMWMMAPQDTAAVKAWIADVANPAQGRDVLASLPSLQVGQGWVWAPRAGVFAQIKFRPIRTFDSSRAPALDEPAPDARLSVLPIEELRAALAAEVPAAGETAPAKRSSKGELEAAEQRGYERGLKEGEHLEWRRWMDRAHREFNEDIDKFRAVLKAEAEARGTSTEPAAHSQRPLPVQGPQAAPARMLWAKAPPTAQAAPSPKPRPAARKSGDARGATRKVLDALAWWAAVGFDPVQRQRACVLAGYSPKASTFGVYVSELAREGLVRTPAPGFLALTDAGREQAEAPATTILAAARGLLSPAEARVFETLRAAGAKGLPRDLLAEALGLSRSASTLGVYVGRLSSLGFVDTPKRGLVRVVDWLLREPG